MAEGVLEPQDEVAREAVHEAGQGRRRPRETEPAREQVGAERRDRDAPPSRARRNHGSKSARPPIASSRTRKPTWGSKAPTWGFAIPGTPA